MEGKKSHIRRLHFFKEHSPLLDWFRRAKRNPLAIGAQVSRHYPDFWTGYSCREAQHRRSEWRNNPLGRSTPMSLMLLELPGVS